MVDTYRDPSRSVEDRVADLVDRMDIDEKVAQLGCVWITSLVRGDRVDHDAAVAQLRNGIGQITRIGASTGLRPAGSASLMNELQTIVVERTRLGIPLLVHEESVAGYLARDATVFPQALALACSWNPDLLAEIGEVIREQMVAVGARLTLAPVLDVARDPRWGRVEETYGEDPVLCGTLGAAYVRAVQGAGDLSRGVAATGKHFLGYAMADGGRNHGPVQLGPRELREVYAEPFAAAIRDAELASIMNSYSSIDGVPCAGSEAILTGLLRGELGFDGVVVADYFAVGLLATHHRTAATPAEAAVQALRAGLDAELPATDCYASLPAEVAAGRLSMEVVDEAVRRVLRLKFRLGLFEQPYVDAERAAAVFETPAQRALARRAASEAVVLLTNDGVLPLDVDRGTIAVLGPGADDERLLQGDYHYPAHIEIALRPEVAALASGTLSDAPGEDLLPESGGAFALGMHYTPHVTPLAAFRAAYGSDRVVHERGCDVSGDDRSGIAAAAAAARSADVAVVVVAGRSGLVPSATVGEARDAMDLGLTGVQQLLVDEVTATGTPTVVVVLSGRVHALTAAAEKAAALVQAFPLGEEGGAGLVDVLTGATPPSGRLPVTMPRHVGQVPVFAGHRAGGRTSMFYSAYTDGPTDPLFPFGHGLTYTTFEYVDVAVTARDTSSPVQVRAVVRNRGPRDGTEVVQLYGTDLVGSVARPARQLLGFARVDLAAGAAATVHFTVHPSRLAFYDPAMRFVCEPGELKIAVGRSSADLPLETVVTVSGDTVEYRQRDVVPTTHEIGPVSRAWRG
jgi:beta-glucosidase